MASPSTKKPVVERCWTLVGTRQRPFWHARRRQPTSGEPAEVTFDAAWTLDREETRGDIVGFYHTHPAGSPEPSQRDIKTMRAWVSAFGKPLLCVIEGGNATEAYLFDDDESTGVRLPACETFPRGFVVVLDAE